MHLEAFFPWVAASLLYYIIIKTKLHLEKQNAGHCDALFLAWICFAYSLGNL